jgi:hypothetical protein
LEHASYGMPQPGDEVVEDKFRIMGSRSCVTLDFSVKFSQNPNREGRLTYICLVSCIDVSLKYAVGPWGRWMIVRASTDDQFPGNGGKNK